MKPLFIFLLICISTMAIAQHTAIDIHVVKPIQKNEVVGEEPIALDKVFQVVDQMPQYPGGDMAMQKFIQNNIRYPEMERENDIQGRVVVGFVIDEEGNLSDISIKKGVSRGIDAEALRVVKLLPKFRPGKQEGKTVKVQFVLPVQFVLQEKNAAPNAKPYDPRKRGG